MDFDDEWENFKKLWTERFTFGRVVLSFAFAFSLLSVGSLADTVFEFKGFLIDAITQYRAVTEPVRELVFSYLDVEDGRYLIDGAILVTLVTGACIRSGMFDVERTTLRPLKYRLPIVIVFLVLFLVLVAWPLANDRLIALLVILPFAPLVIGTGATVGTIIPGQTYRLAFIYTMLVYLTVALLAAISEGILRPLE